MSAPIRRAGAWMAGLVLLVLLVLPAPASAQYETIPVVSWNTYLGGGAADGTALARTDVVSGVLTNAQGETFVTGRTDAPRFPAGASSPMTHGGSDVFVTKFNADGKTVAWTRVFGSPLDDMGSRMVFGNNGDLYVVGTFGGEGVVDGAGNLVPVRGGEPFHGGKEAFLARVEPNGTLSWIIYLGGSGNDQGLGLAVSPADLVYVVGEAAEQVLVVKVDVALPNIPTAKAPRIFGSGDPDRAYGVAIQGDSVYVGGVVGAPVPPALNPQGTFGQGDDDGFVARLDAADTVQWFRYLGGSGHNDDVRDVLVQPGGEVIVVGNTDSDTFPPSAAGTGEDVFLLQVKEDSSLGAQIRVGGTGSEVADGHAAMDSRGNLYIGGKTTSVIGLQVRAFDSSLSTRGSGTDGFVAMIQADLSRRLWASYVGGPTDTPEFVWGLSVGPVGQLTFGGQTTAATEMTPVAASYDNTWNGGEDGFLWRVAVDSTGPSVGSVLATLNQGRIEASWMDFVDLETGVTFEVALGYDGEEENAMAFQPVSTKMSHLFTHVPPGKTYTVTVRATNLVGHSVKATSAGVVVPGTGGGSDGGVDGGTDAGTEDAGVEPENPSVEERSPVGWGCGSAGGGTLLVALMALALLSLRRGRSSFEQ